MCWIIHFSRIIEQNNNNPGAVCDITVEEDNKLYRCHVNVWDGMVTVLQHIRNADDGWEEYGHAIGSIFIDDEDKITTQIF